MASVHIMTEEHVCRKRLGVSFYEICIFSALRDGRAVIYPTRLDGAEDVVADACTARVAAFVLMRALHQQTECNRSQYM